MLKRRALLWFSFAAIGATFAARAENCPEAIEKLKTPEFLARHFKWKAPAMKEGKDSPALPEFDCRSGVPLSVNGAAAPVHQVGLKGQKKRIAIVVPEGGEAHVLTIEPKALETANHKSFAQALPLARELSVWRQVTLTDFEIVDGNLCAKTAGMKDVLNGMAVTCAKKPGSTTVKTPISLGAGILDPAKAQRAALKEFARVEKEEEVPDVKEIFGDKDTVWKLHLGPDAKSSYYVFWMSQLSASGVILMMVRMDGSAQSEVVTGAFEYDPKLVATKIAQWRKTAGE